MPRGNYKHKLSAVQILELFDSGKYAVNLATGIVSSGRTGKPLFTYIGSEQDGKDNADYLWTRLYCSPFYRTLPVAHVVWIVGSRSDIPKGFEIHHEDENRRNNAFLNLFCLHKIDHRKRHGRFNIPQPELVPF